MRDSTEIDLPEELPLSSLELIGLLDRAFPPRCVRLNETMEEAQRYAGIRELVEELLVWKQSFEEGSQEE